MSSATTSKTSTAPDAPGACAAALPSLTVLPSAAGPKKSSKPGYQRAIEVGLRTIHIVSMGLVLGGIGMGGTHDTLLVPVAATVTSGVFLLWTSVRWGCLTLRQGAGWALLLKLGFLGMGNLFPGARLAWYVAATAVTSIGSHMPSAWRHFSLPARR
jgi:hypothetical protein